MLSVLAQHIVISGQSMKQSYATHTISVHILPSIFTQALAAQVFHSSLLAAAGKGKLVPQGWTQGSRLSRQNPIHTPTDLVLR